MVTRSPYLTVRSIASQALAALHGSGPPKKLFPESLWSDIDSLIIQCLRRSRTTVGPGYDLTESIPTIERLGRAVLCSSTSMALISRDRLYAFIAMFPNDIHVAALHSFLLERDKIVPKDTKNEGCTAITRSILRDPSNSTSLGHLHPWLRYQLSSAAMVSAANSMYKSADWDQFSRSLLQTISFSRCPILKEETLLSLLFTRFTFERNVLPKENTQGGRVLTVSPLARHDSKLYPTQSRSWIYLGRSSKSFRT
jgi:hypothetical protein